MQMCNKCKNKIVASTFCANHFMQYYLDRKTNDLLYSIGLIPDLFSIILEYSVMTDINERNYHEIWSSHHMIYGFITDGDETLFIFSSYLHLNHSFPWQATHSYTEKVHPLKYSHIKVSTMRNFLKKYLVPSNLKDDFTKEKLYKLYSFVKRNKSKVERMLRTKIEN